MKNFRFLSSFLVTTSFLICSVAIAQTKFDKTFSKINASYQKGFPGPAYKKNKSILNSLAKKELSISDAGIKSYTNQARLLVAMGNHNSYEGSINEAVNITKKLYNDTGAVASKTFLDIADIYFVYGNHRKAQVYLDKSFTAYNNSKKNNKDFLPSYHLLKSRTNLEQGFLWKADSLAKLAAPGLLARVIKTEPAKDSKGRVKQVKLSSAEVLKRKTAYAWATSTRARSTYEIGLYSKADTLLTASNNWIKSNMGTKNPVYAENLSSLAVQQETAGNLRKAKNLYEDAFSSVKKRRDMYYFNSFNKVLYGLMIKDDFASTPSKSMSMLDRKTRMYFKKDNIYFANKELLDEWFTAKKSKFNKVEERLDKLVNQKNYIPLYHPSKIRAQEIYVLLDKRDRKLKSVEDTLLSIIKVAKELYGENSPAYHKRKLELGKFYLEKTNNLKKAEEIYQESLIGVVIKQMVPANNNYVWYLNDIGTLYFQSENLNTASEYLKKAESQAKINYPDQPKYAMVLGNLASVNLALGKYPVARDMFKTAEIILNKGDDSEYTPEFAKSYQNIAEGYSTFGMYSNAQSCLAKSERIMQDNAKKGYDPAENSSPDDLAELYIKTGKYRDAEKVLKQSIAEKEKARGSNVRELVKPFNLLGKLYYTTGDYGQSETYLNKATKLSLSFLGDSSLKYAESLKTLRKLYSAFGDYEKAEKVCQKQIEITTKILGKDNINYADAISDLALIRYNLGYNVSSTRSMLGQSINIIKTKLGSDNPYYINSLKSLAQFQIETNQISSADSLIKIVDSYWNLKLGKDNTYTAEIESMKGDLNRKQGKNDFALEKYGNALNLYRKAFSSRHPDYVKTQSKIAKTYFSKGDYKNTLSTLNITTQGYYNFISKYFPALSFGEKSKYWESIKGDFEFFNTLALKMKDQNPDLIGQMYDYELATKALLLSNSIRVRQRINASGDKGLIDKFDKWNEKKELYTKSLSYTSEQLSQEKIDQVKLEKEIEELEKELSTSSEEFAQSFENRTFKWKDVKKTLKTNEAAIEIVRFRHFTNNFTDSVIYAALIVTESTNGNPELIILPNGNQMEKKYIKYYRNTIKFKNEDDFSYDIFWKAFEPKLKDIQTIYLSGEGVYNQINIETLEDSKGKYMIDKYNLILVSNTKDLVLNRLYEKKKNIKEGANSILLIGNPLFYSDESKVSERTIKDLDGAELEAKEISDLYSSNKWKSNLLTKQYADEEKFKSLEGSKIIHIATHGYFQPDNKSSKQNSDLAKGEINPLFRSGILLANAGDILDNDFTTGNVNSQNGILTAYEAMNLNLEQTELVTLSACETGLGDIQIGEGVAGLQRAFLVAGADNVVMSLFKVSDEITEKLMLSFYNKWLKMGDKRKAFIEAKKEIKSQHPESIYWGSFIMIGVN
ncbi:MAG: CHAT domain-containing protein [Opitutaceae bacterium]|nr:CHAT domain-containing protein [Cytophagales bacterium]